MPLLEIEIPEIETPLPAMADTLIRDAQNRIDLFTEIRRSQPIRRFVPSDFLLAHDVISTVAALNLAPGKRFCEWGSGFGVVAMIACFVGYEAHGIEIEADLVDQAELIAADFDLPVEFHCGSYIPHGYDSFQDDIGSSEQLTREALLPSERYGGTYNAVTEDDPLAPADFDVIYVYPWPGEEKLVQELFEATAAEGAILISNHAVDKMRVRRLVTHEL